MKVLIISQPNSYISNLKEFAYSHDIDIVSVCTSLEELRKSSNLISNSKVDYALFFDSAEEKNLSVNDAYNILSQIDLGEKMVILTDQEESINFAIYFKMMFVNPNNIEPTILIKLLENSYKLFPQKMEAAPQVEPVKERDRVEPSYEENRYDRRSQRDRDREFKRSSKERRNEIRDLNTPAREEDSNRYEERNKMGAVHTELKPIMVCTASSKGGVGKTTTAIELASVLAARAKSITPEGRAKIRHPWEFKVCLVDFNPSFDTMSEIIKCTHNVPRRELPSLNDWFEEFEERFLDSLPISVQREYDECAQNGEPFDLHPYIEEYADNVVFEEQVFEDLTVRDPETGLYVIPAIHDALDVAQINHEYIAPVLKRLNTYFDVVIVDTGNNISNFTINTIDTVDKSLIICEKSNGAAATVDKFLKTLQEIGVSSAKCSLVLSNAHSQGDDKLAKEYEYRFGMGIVADIPYDKNVIKSHENHEFYAVNNPKSEYAKTIVKLAHWIYPLWIKLPTEDTAKKRKKLFGIF